MQANWTYIVIAVCVFATLLIGVLEYKRRNKARLVVRLIAIVLAVAALACIALPLKYSGWQSIVSVKKVILLTEGFDSDSITSDANNRIFTLDAAVKKAYPRATLIYELDDIKASNGLHIYGNGLKPYELAQLNDVPLIFHPSTELTGLKSANWTEQVKAGESIKVQGIYNNASAQKVKLVLKGSAIRLDSVTVAPGSEARFSLSAKPSATGRLVYQLYADTALQGDIPVQVEPVKPLKVLMLSASPDFETKFLKNWLAENGYAVAARNAISKGKYNTNFINLSQADISKLTGAVLSKFDVMIGDLSVLASLGGGESAVLRQQVSDAGLGVIIRADSTDKRIWLQSGFQLNSTAGKEPVPSSINIGGTTSQSGKLVTGNTYLINQNGTQALVKAGNLTLAAATQAGAGKVVFTTLNNTYSWMLGGYKQDYTALWSALISKAARKSDDVPLKVFFPTLPVVKEPTDFIVDRGNTEILSVNNEQVGPAQNAEVPFQWLANYQPTRAGWQTLKNGAITADWYAYPAHQWLSLQAAEKRAATAAYAASHKPQSIVTKQIQQKVLIDVPKIYFYMLLLAACTFLWIESKRFS